MTGACVGVLALLVHRLGGTTLPWGLLLAAAVSVAVSAAAAVLGDGGLLPVAYGLGWGVAVLTALAGRPEGDYLVAADWRGWVLLVGVTGAVVVTTVLGMVVVRPARTPSEPATPGPATRPSTGSTRS